MTAMSARHAGPGHPKTRRSRPAGGGWRAMQPHVKVEPEQQGQQQREEHEPAAAAGDDVVVTAVSTAAERDRAARASAIVLLDDGTHTQAVAYRLSAEERVRAQDDAILKELRDVLSSDRTLFGEKMHTARDLFQQMDRDGSGMIEADEFRVAFQRLGLGITPAQLEHLMGLMDRDGNGAVDYRELLDALDGAVQMHSSPEKAMSEHEQRIATAQERRRQARAQPSQEQPPPPQQQQQQLQPRPPPHCELLDSASPEAVLRALALADKLADPPLVALCEAILAARVFEVSHCRAFVELAARSPADAARLMRRAEAASASARAARPTATRGE
jgi:hypothetical protein